MTVSYQVVGEVGQRDALVPYHVDLLPERLDRHLDATLWLRVAPAHLERVGYGVSIRVRRLKQAETVISHGRLVHPTLA